MLKQYDEDISMLMTVDVPDQTVQDLTTLTEESNPVIALGIAAKEYVRYLQRMKLLDLAGKVEMSESWIELDKAELNDNPYGAPPSAD